MFPTSEEGARLVALADAGRRLASVQGHDLLQPLVAELAGEVLAATSSSLARHDPATGSTEMLHHTGAPDAGEGANLTVQVMVGPDTWGEIRAARSPGLPDFDTAAVAAGEALSELVAAAIVRIADREQLHALAYRDGLTGLANRRTIDDRLEELFGPVDLPRPIGLILCDVDRLKQVNDLHGHLAGDQLLCDVAALLTEVASEMPTAVAARLGGDEFCLLVEDADSEQLEEVTRHLVAAADRLPRSAGLSCGWAVADQRPGGAATPTVASRALLRLADAAQYRAKRAAREQRNEVLAGPVTMADPQTGTRLVDDVLTELNRVGNDLQERLVVVATACARALSAASWTVSVSVDGGPATIVVNDGAQRVAFGEGYPMAPGMSFALPDYPATARALEGGCFHATMDLGDDAERAFLAANGYDEIIGAGFRQDPSSAWLVEVVGDSVSEPLAPYLGILRTLVEIAHRASVPTPMPELIAG